ncbi:hypothetical protein OPT61_g3607 [Boeremia exigua]|uniref:Uncharacterized protein n=1 Tax=Boeremia exigua TaxID=749465 RepID=A0ACC2IHF3_9PLEO|nr:hypothetical protein OPT61_g3607 [Boeremia exigua]
MSKRKRPAISNTGRPPPKRARQDEGQDSTKPPAAPTTPRFARMKKSGGKAAESRNQEQEFNEIVADAEAGGQGLNRATRVTRQRHNLADDDDDQPAANDAGSRKDKGKGKAPALGGSEAPKKTSSGSSKKAKKGGKKDPWDRPQSRGRRASLDEDYTPDKPDTSDKYSIRRILGERNVGNRTFYMVDWYPTWVNAASVRQREVDDWRANEEETFQWGKDTV